MSQASPSQVNAAMRNALLASAPRGRKNLGLFTGTFGQSTRIKLFNVGIITWLQLVVSVPVTIGTATAVASAKGPYNAISRVRVTDYDNTDRVNLSGFQLFILNCVRNRIPYGLNNVGPTQLAGATGGVFTNPAQALAVGAQTVSFILDIPLAYDPENDLRGAIMGQTAVGEMYLTVDWAASYYTNNDIESLYAGAATTTVVANGSPSVTVYQEYLLPQPVLAGGKTPIPVIDLLTVYELAGFVKSSDNLGNGIEKLIPYPNFRSVIGAYFNFVNNGAFTAANISNFRLIANGNNILRDYGYTTQQFNQRNYCEGDLTAGNYFFLHRTKPIETALFGNVQMGVTPSVAPSGNFYLEYLFESFFTKGQQLPGINQG